MCLVSLTVLKCLAHLHDRGPQSTVMMVVVVAVAAAPDAAPRGVAYGLLDVQRVLERGIIVFILALRASSHFESGVCCGNIPLSA